MSEIRDEQNSPSVGMSEAVGRMMLGSKYDEQQTATEQQRVAELRRFEADTKHIEMRNAWHAAAIVSMLLIVVATIVAALVLVL